MEIKEEIQKAIEIIKKYTGKNQEEISVGMGYGATYISTLLKRGGNQKFLDSLKDNYPIRATGKGCYLVN